MSEKFSVRVMLTHEASGVTIYEQEDGVDLNDDEIQIAASTLAYALIEDAWGVVEDYKEGQENA